MNNTEWENSKAGRGTWAPLGRQKRDRPTPSYLEYTVPAVTNNGWVSMMGNDVCAGQLAHCAPRWLGGTLPRPHIGENLHLLRSIGSHPHMDQNVAAERGVVIYPDRHYSVGHIGIEQRGYAERGATVSQQAQQLRIATQQAQQLQMATQQAQQLQIATQQAQQLQIATQQAQQLQIATQQAQHLPPAVKETQHLPPAVKEAQQPPTEIKETQQPPTEIKETQQLLTEIKETQQSPTEIKETQQPPPAENGCSHAALQRLLRRIIALEFTGRCTQRSIAVVQAICDTLCQNPVDVVKVMEVLNECFVEAVKTEQQQQLLNYWYIADAVLKLFRDRPLMLNAVVIAWPHLLLEYVPWKKSKLAQKSWFQREKDESRYEHLFLTWTNALPKSLLDELWVLWRDGIPQVGVPDFTTR